MLGHRDLNIEDYTAILEAPMGLDCCETPLHVLCSGSFSAT